MDLAKKSFGVWCGLYKRFDGRPWRLGNAESEDISKYSSSSFWTFPVHTHAAILKKYGDKILL